MRAPSHCSLLTPPAEPSRPDWQRDFAPTLALEWAMWAPLDVANFALVPVRHQLLVANLGCLAESIALSFVKANGFSIPGAH